MPTFRFGVPPADAAEQVVLQSRWGDPTVPKRGEWRDTFVYGIGMTATALNATWRNVKGSGNTSQNINSPTTRIQALQHPDSGIIVNHFNVVVYWNAANSAATGWMNTLDAIPGVPIKLIQGFLNDVDGEWLNLTDAQAAVGNLDAVLAAPMAAFADSPSIIGYCLTDDFFSTGDRGDRARELMDRIPELDSAGRPATPSWNSSSTMVPDETVDIFIQGAGSYPNRYNGSGGSRVEGDFTFGDPADWSEYFRNTAIGRPTSSIWVWAQAHQLNPTGGGVNDLEYPTPREIRKQVWELVGAGVKGILWFVYQDEPAGPWVGLAHPDSRARMAAVAEMGARLTPNIRARIMRCGPIAVASSPFIVTGGGPVNWQFKDFNEGYLGTLYDPVADVYYLVPLNRTLTAASMAIESAPGNQDPLVGTLVNLEDGTEVALGDNFTLQPLDGTIFRFKPQVVVGDQFIITLRDGTEITV